MNRLWLKLNARRNLSGKYGDALVVAVLASLIGGALNLVMPSTTSLGLPAVRYSFFDGMSGLTGEVIDLDRVLDQIGEYLEVLSRQVWLIGLLAGLILLGLPLYKILVGNVVTVGMERWFLRAAHTDMPPPISLMFSLFKRGEYGKAVGGMVWKTLWLFLWSLPPFLVLGIGLIPQQLLLFHALTQRQALTQGLVYRFSKQTGLPAFLFDLRLLAVTVLIFLFFIFIYIRKQYRYRLVPYILADNPAYGARKALKLSKDMTRGRVWSLFMLDLSFLGWILLSLMCICFSWVALTLLAPYYRMTWAEAYKKLRDDAAGLGLIRMEELGYVRMA